MYFKMLYKSLGKSPNYLVFNKIDLSKSSLLTFVYYLSNLIKQI